MRGLVFSVQSSALPPPELEARVDGFLDTFRATLAAMPEAELDTYREALAVQVSDVDKRLAQQVGHLVPSRAKSRSTSRRLQAGWGRVHLYLCPGTCAQAAAQRGASGGEGGSCSVPVT